jgi:hypothetical protein
MQPTPGRLFDVHAMPPSTEVHTYPLAIAAKCRPSAEEATPYHTPLRALVSQEVPEFVDVKTGTGVFTPYTAITLVPLEEHASENQSFDRAGVWVQTGAERQVNATAAMTRDISSANADLMIVRVLARLLELS